MTNRDITHGSKILDRFFVSVPYIYCCTTFNSAVKTKHKAVLMSPVGNALPTPIGVSDTCSKRRCFDCREANIRNLQQALSDYNWKPFLAENDIESLYSDFVKVINWHVNKCILVKMVKIKHKTHKFIAQLIKVLLVKRSRLLRKGKIQQANILAEKFGRLRSTKVRHSAGN